MPSDRAACVPLRRFGRGDQRPRAADRRAPPARSAPPSTGRDRRGPVLVRLQRPAEARAADAPPAARGGRGVRRGDADERRRRRVLCDPVVPHLRPRVLSARRPAQRSDAGPARRARPVRTRPRARARRARARARHGAARRTAHLPAACRVAVRRRSVGDAVVHLGRQRLAAVHVRRLPTRLRDRDPPAVRPDGDRRCLRRPRRRSGPRVGRAPDPRRRALDARPGGRTARAGPHR